MPALRGAIHARFSSENQRAESLENQERGCQMEARRRGVTVLPDHGYKDPAMSGAVADRPQLQALNDAVRQRLVDVLLVDDLSRLARDNMLC